MEYGWQWLGSVLASSAGAAVLVGAIGYLGRAQIAHWLAKDLEAMKAGHQRELEAYKVSLIAETERAKAAQEIKKASALMAAEKEFNALNELHLASQGNARFIMAHWRDLTKFPTPLDFVAMRTRCHRLEQACDAFHIFLPTNTDRGKLLVYRVRLAKFVEDCENPNRVVDGDDADQSVQLLLNAEVAVDVVVTLALERLRSMN
ncbi:MULTISPECIES: hypothetical protein [Variovorax]|uniref:hypothetical protein n=1 Tax=Variovorax TaxID=34072 RepID=UPI00285ED67E|nr:hypothetical protein [Variovorax sp. 3319]MDR6890387.1 hypothetical protein [Variovorax sp. 3319]